MAKWQDTVNTAKQSNYSDAPATLERMCLSINSGIEFGQDYTQNASLLTTYINAADFFQDTGTANAYRLIADSGRKEVYQNVNGGLIRFRPAFPNGGASTVSVGEKPIVNLLTEAGMPLSGGELSPNKDAYIRCNGTDYLLLNNASNQITVQDFGAAGDGVTDDTIAINNALAFSKKVDFGVNKSYIYSGIPPFNGHHIQAVDCEIIVPAGSYSYTSERYIKGCSGNALKFTFTNGTSYSANGSSYTGSAKNYAVTFSGISSTAGLAINDFVLIRTLIPSTTNVVWVTGCWKVTNVTANTITVNNTYHGATPPSLASITSVTIKKLPTKIQWTGDNGFSFHNGGFFNFSGGAVFIGDWDVLAGTGTQGAHGIVINAPRIIGGASSNTTAMGGGGVGTNADICLYGWGEQGFAMEGSAFASMNFIISCANRKRGIYISGSSNTRAKFSITNGNGEDGCIGDECSNSAFSLGYSCGNGLNGYWSTSLSMLNLASTIAVGNLTNGYEGRGATRILCDNTKSFNNGAKGYSVTDGANLDADNAIADGNISDGFYNFNGGTIDANNASSINNGGWGVNGQFGFINFSGSGDFTGNTLGEFNPQMQGILGYRNNGIYSFLHQELKTTDGGLLRVIGSASLATTFSNSSIGDLSIQTASGGGMQIRNGNVVRPIVDNTTSLGEAMRRWTTVFAATPTINTSDENAKTGVREVNDVEIKIAQKLKKLGRIFQFKDAVEKKGDNARLHSGVIAQEVAQVFTDEGLDPKRYGLYCEDDVYKVLMDITAENEQDIVLCKKDEFKTAMEIENLNLKVEKLIQNKKIEYCKTIYGIRYIELLTFIILNS